MHTSTASAGSDFGKVDFGKIIEKSQNILASGGLIDSFSTLAGIQRANQNLAKRARPDADTELTARIFFASHGMDVSHQLEALRAVCSPTSSSLSDFKRQRESDASSFLESQKQTLMTSTIEDSLRLVSAFSRDIPDDNLREEWQATKRRVLDALSSCPLPTPSSTLGSSSSTSSAGSDGSFESNAASVTEASQKLSLALSSSMLPFSDRTFSNTSGEITFTQKTYAKAVAHNNRSYAEDTSNVNTSNTSSTSSLSSLISLFSGAASYIEQTLAANINADTSTSLALAADCVELWDLISSLAKDPIPHPSKSSLSISTTATAAFSLSALAEMALASRAAGYLERSFHDHVRGVITQDPGLLARVAGSSAAYSSLHSIHRSVHEAAAYLLSPVYQARFVRDNTSPVGTSAMEGGISIGSMDGYNGGSTFSSSSSSSTAPSTSSTSTLSSTPTLTSGSGFGIPPFADSVWSLIYYVFRMGDIEAAAALLAVASSSTRTISAPILTTAFETIISGSSSSSTSNASIFTASTSEALSALANDLETELFAEELSTSDPYRVAIYHLVGRIQLSANVMRYRLNRYVFLNVEDLIWSHLHLCTFTPTPTSTAYVSGFSMPTRLSAPPASTTATSTKWSLSALKKHILRLVAQQQSQHRLFTSNTSTEFENPDQDRLLSVRLLLLTQQFPEAIRVLLRIDTTVALHVAIALTFAGVLPVTGNITGNSYSSAINASLLAAVSLPSASALSTPMNSLGENVMSSSTAVLALITRYARAAMAKESTVAFHYIYLLRRMLEIDGNVSSLSTSLPASAGAALANSILASTSSSSFGDGMTTNTSSSSSSTMPMDEILLVELLTQSSDLETLIGTSKDPFASLTELDTRGIVPSYYPLTVVARVVARAADVLCARDGPSQRSLTLLALAGRSGRVVAYLSSKLAACAMKPASDPVKASLMLDVTRYVNAANASLSTTAATTSNDAGTTSELQRSIQQLSTILSIAGFFSLLHAGKDRQEAALTVLAQTGFLPFSPQSIAASSLLGSSGAGNKALSNDLASAIRSEATSPENIAARRQRKAESNGDVLSLLGSVALASVTAAYNLYADAQNETVREFWRLQARTLLDCVINEWADCITVNNRMQILRIESMIPF